MPKDDEIRKALRKMVFDPEDEGDAINAGWQAFRRTVLRTVTMRLVQGEIPADEAFRLIFFSGASYLFGALMTMLDEREEATVLDTARMGRIEAELRAFDNEIRESFGLKKP